MTDYLARLRMPENVRWRYGHHRSKASDAITIGDWAEAWSHLEKAHIVAQRYVVAHVGSHVAMFRLGWHPRTPLRATAPIPVELAPVLQVEAS